MHFALIMLFAPRNILSADKESAPAQKAMFLIHRALDGKFYATSNPVITILNYI